MEQHEASSRLNNDEEEEEVVFRSPRTGSSMLTNPFRSGRDYDAPPDRNGTIGSTDVHLEEVDVEAGRLNPMFHHENNEETSTTSHHSDSLVEPTLRKDWKHDIRERAESEGEQSDTSGGRSSTVFFSFCPPFCRRNALKIGLSSFAVLLITLAIAFGIGR